jgi:sucrose phosphorylase
MSTASGAPGLLDDAHRCGHGARHRPRRAGQEPLWHRRQEDRLLPVNATFFSALGEDERKLLLARAIQLFMPGIPQVWYLDLFAGKNDYAAADAGGAAGHKEINRTNLSLEDVREGIRRPVVRDQLELLRLRNTASAFRGTLGVADTDGQHLELTWRNGAAAATLRADLAALICTLPRGS